MNFPIIQALKEYKSHFNANQFISLPADSPFGNLNLNWMEIVIRIECINDSIVLLYDDFYILKNQLKKSGSGTLDQGYRNKFYTEQIFYWLRKTTDELISLISILNYFKQNNKYPDKIKPSSIGEFLNSKNTFTEDFDKFKTTFQTLNEVSNGFKHSFINPQTHAFRGSEYPIVFAYTLRFNDLINKPAFQTLDLGKFLGEYNNFLLFAKGYIKNNFEIVK